MDKIVWFKNQAVLSTVEKQNGIGFIQAVDMEDQTLKVYFPLVKEDRLYSAKTTVLQRYLLREGKTLSHQGVQELVNKVVLHGGVAQYSCDSGLVIWEYDLDPDITKHLSSIERFISGPWSHHKSYDLREQGYALSCSLSKDRLSGPIASRINLLPHQIYIADKISQEERPRAILADEVGLGKTIEAGLVLSCLNAVEKADKVLIIVPESLVHQWAQEFSTLFETLFVVMNGSRYDEEERTLGISPFQSNNRIIISIEELERSDKKSFEATSVDWDLVIVDEAHHLEWTPEEPSLKWHFVNEIAKKSKGLLLLTATPRQRGFSTQFGLLHMIDPKRFSNFEDFIVEMELIDSVAKCVKEIKEEKYISDKHRDELKFYFQEDSEIIELLSQPTKLNSSDIIPKLIDRHGTGRVLYRNRKASLDYFPQRNVKIVNLKSSLNYQNVLAETDPDGLTAKNLMDFTTGRKVSLLDNSLAKDLKDDVRSLWLADYIKESNEKTVIICSEKYRVLEVAKNIKTLLGLTADEFNKKIMLFHEGIEGIKRDQGAALFAEPEGPQVLIASEMGGEGRNFQFVKNIILFDIPTNPEKLEQRIGRLDRIGQGSEIFIHVPVIEDSPEQVLFSWYHQGLDSFVEANPASGILLENFGERILDIVSYFFPKSEKYKSRSQELKQLIVETKAELIGITKELEETQDILLELNSFDEEKTEVLLSKIKRQENYDLIKSFLFSSFDFYGVDYGDYDKRGSVQVNFDSLSFVENLPKLGDDDQAVLTFDRQSFLMNRRSHFMSYSNQFVQNLLEKATREEQGRFSIGFFKDDKSEKRLLFQSLYTLETKGPRSLELSNYMPLSLKDIVVDSKGCKVENNEISFKSLNSFKENTRLKKIISSQKFIDIFTKNMNSFQSQVDNWRSDIVKTSLKKVELQYNEELSNLRYLVKVNPMYTEEDIKHCCDKFNKIKDYIQSSHLSLDAVRVIFVNP